MVDPAHLIARACRILASLGADARRWRAEALAAQARYAELVGAGRVEEAAEFEAQVVARLRLRQVACCVRVEEALVGVFLDRRTVIETWEDYITRIEAALGDRDLFIAMVQRNGIAAKVSGPAA